ncbi:MAG: DUF262 domain-containing protein [Cytophagales bacterium]|nr:MAG: DUF262 domain-containing protein [Cytophagales bacterium]
MINIEEKIELLEKDIATERKRVSTDRLDISFGELINLYRNNELVIRPEYQRLFRWTNKQKTALIESILLSIPIPPIFVSEDKNGIWELIDGLQRVSTFISFFGELQKNISEIEYSFQDDEDEELSPEEEQLRQEKIGNKWLLESGGIIESLEGFNIDTLPTNLKINLKRAVCRVEILRGDSSTSMKYELFKRLNSGGSKLKPQEIRNAIFRGIDTRLNELLLKLSLDERFQNLTKLSNAKRQELYDQELILRFISFLNNAENVNDNTENYLNDFMESAVSNPNFQYDVYESQFVEVLNILTNLNDDSLFRNSRNLFVPAVFEGVTIGIAQNIERFRNDSELLMTKVRELKNDDDFRKFSGSASNSKSRIRTRLNRVQEIFSN